MAYTWCTEGGDEIALHERVAAATAAWSALAPCAGPTFEDLGACDGPYADLSVVWGDPDDEIEEGVLAVEYTEGGRSRLVLNDVRFSTDEAIAAGECVDAPSLDLVILHQLGDWLGLPHACDDGEPCAGDAADAVMNWSLGMCESRTLNAVDEALLDAVFAPLTSPHEAPPVVRGLPPFEVCVSVEGSADGATVSWDFGDGGAGEGVEACHTYTDAGSFEIAAAITYATCADTQRIAPYAYVTSLEPTVTDAPEEANGCAHTRAGLGAAVLGVALALRRRRR